MLRGDAGVPLDPIETACHGGFRPYRLVSLWDMITIQLRDLIEAASKTAQMYQLLITLEGAGISKAGAISATTLAPVLAAAEYVSRTAKDADLDATQASADRLVTCITEIKEKHNTTGKIPRDQETIRLLESYVAQLNTTLQDQLQARMTLLLSAHECRLFDPREPLFGDDVFNRFAIANDDIAEAGKCLGLGRGTATVFHLMRIMEAGLKALGNELGIPYAPSWESYISQMQKLLDTKNYANLTPDQKAKRPFYQEILSDLISVKTAWRNPTMHIVRSYDISQARVAFDAVCGFMQHLAKELSAIP